MNKNTIQNTIVIFGGSGDLTKRKLIPALYNLGVENKLPNNCKIIGFSASDMNTEGFKKWLSTNAKPFLKDSFDEQKWRKFLDRLHFVNGRFTEEKDYVALEKKLNKIERAHANRLYYLATPPRFFEEIISQLGRAKMVAKNNASTNTTFSPWRRVVIEKPFGKDYPSAKALNQSIHKYLDED
jgi:glucose-6-phosphate 1-dehydrogenase